MKVLLSAVAVLVSLYAVDASAQSANLSGRWQCMALCLGPTGSYAFITQNGWDMNILNDVGEPSRAWVDYPGHIWIDRSNQGAIFWPNGFTLQFDRGAIWQRAPDMPPPNYRG